MDKVKDKQKCLTTRGQLKLVVAIVLVSWLYVLNNLAYFAGFTNSYLLVFLTVTLWLPLIGVSLGCVLYQFHKTSTYGVCDPKTCLFQKRLLYVSVVILIGSFLFHKPWRIRHTEELRDRMIRMNFEKELPLIREWHSQVGNRGGVYPVMIPVDNCPPVLKKLRPRFVWLGSVEDTQENVSEILGLSWAGGFIGGWGIAIGPESMNIPESSKTQYVLHSPLEPMCSMPVSRSGSCLTVTASRTGILYRRYQGIFVASVIRRPGLNQTAC